MLIIISSIKAKMGKFVEMEDLFVGLPLFIIFLLLITMGNNLFFALAFLAFSIFLMMPISFSKKNRMWKVLCVLFLYLIRPKHFVYQKVDTKKVAVREIENKKYIYFGIAIATIIFVFISSFMGNTSSKKIQEPKLKELVVEVNEDKVPSIEDYFESFGSYSKDDFKIRYEQNLIEVELPVKCLDKKENINVQPTNNQNIYQIHPMAFTVDENSEFANDWNEVTTDDSSTNEEDNNTSNNLENDSESSVNNQPVCKNLVLGVVGTYNVIIYNEEHDLEYKTTLTVKDSKAPIVESQDVILPVGTPYNINQFLKSINDNYDENCTYIYVNELMGNYTQQGEYEIQIKVSDNSNNEVIVTSKLIIK